MKKIFITALILFSIVISGLSQNALLSLSGHVFDDATGVPVANHLVTAEIMSGGMVEMYDMITNDSGFYGDSIPVFNQGIFHVFTFDCLWNIHSFNGTFNPGNYSFSHDFNICTDSIPTGCTAIFTYTVPPMGGNTVFFTDMSVGSPTDWLWDFGDGQTSQLQNPIHEYDDSGTYPVCLTISSPDTTCYDVYCEDVIVGNSGSDCDNWFWYDTFDQFTFEFVGEGIPPADTYSWDFGDGNTGSGQYATHTYDESLAGQSLLVSLTTTHLIGGTTDTCVAVSSQDIWIGNQGNDCFNWFIYETLDQFTFEFVGEGIPPADTYFWDFGDGNTGSGQYATHTYDEGLSGQSLMVSLTTIHSIGGTIDTCVAFSSQNILIGNQGNNCINWFWYDTFDQFTFEFVGEGIPPADTYSWDFGDGNTGYGQFATHTYDESLAGQSLLVSLTTTHLIGGTTDTCVAVSSQDVWIGNQGNDCINWFIYETLDQFTFEFIGEGIPPANSYFWDFGDGNTGFGQYATHTYDEGLAGQSLLVSLTTIHSIGGTTDTCVAFSSQDIWIGNGGGNCIANFDYTIDSVPTGAYVVQFTDLSIGNPSFWMWNFGDGDYSEEQNPEHIYYNQGTYLVCLTIFGDSASMCFDTYCEEIVIGSGGSGDCENFFWYFPTGDYSFMFAGEAFPIPADEYYWDFGDGTTGSGQQIDHTFDPALGDVFMVTLTTISYYPSGDTCIAESMQEVWINNGGWDCGNWFWYETLDNLTFDFYGESFPFPANEFVWDFGDGNTATGMEVSHTFDPAMGDVFTVTLTTVSFDPATGDSCTAVSSQVIFTGGGVPDCENWFWYESVNNFEYDFFGESFPMPAFEYFWDFGDGSTATGQNATHTFDPATGNIFEVCLTTLSYTFTGDTCVATSCQQIYLGGQSGQEIYGTIFTDNTPVDYALVGLFGIDPAGSFVFEFTMTEPATGFYFFENVPDGDYYIFASLTPQSVQFYDYFPTYYGDVIFWFDADLISLGNAANPYDINMVPISSYTSGPGLISGNVLLEDGKKGPGENIVIMLMDENSNALGYVQTNETGNFEFSDLSYGTYKLQVEMPGVNSEVATILLSEDNISQDIQFYVKNSSAYLNIKQSLQAVALVGNIYPNPVKSIANLKIDATENTSLVVKVIDQTGSVVSYFPVNINKGGQVIEIETLNWK
ncbi:MAG: PKD domain-containing protein, partial [Bacteroidales bacterium]|nr:PKD domain-containing protein [Bacteroidales bacterium]